jgi:predicted nucleic acid-binding Zn ribbon protein
LSANEIVMSELGEISNFCLTCGKPLRGRTDKKFCDTSCRNVFHNERLRVERGETASIEKILKRNRRVLSRCLDGRATLILSREELLIRGLRFDYHTHYWDNQQGERYYYCFDHGYRLLDTGDYLVVQRQEKAEEDKHLIKHKKKAV